MDKTQKQTLIELECRTRREKVDAEVEMWERQAEIVHFEKCRREAKLFAIAVVVLAAAAAAATLVLDSL